MPIGRRSVFAKADNASAVFHDHRIGNPDRFCDRTHLGFCLAARQDHGNAPCFQKVERRPRRLEGIAVMVEQRSVEVGEDEPHQPLVARCWRDA